MPTPPRADAASPWEPDDREQLVAAIVETAAQTRKHVLQVSVDDMRTFAGLTWRALRQFGTFRELRAEAAGMVGDGHPQATVSRPAPRPVSVREELLSVFADAASRAGKRPEDVTYTDLLAANVTVSDTQREIAREAFRPDEHATRLQAVRRRRDAWCGPRPGDVTGKRLLVIPDAHAHPDYDHERFRALGRFIHGERPDIVVCIGDWADMPSLSSYDKGKRSFEGRRYRRDVDAALDAQEAMFGEIESLNRSGDPVRPWWVMCVGNHEDRIDRAVNDAPELDGTIGLADLAYADFGWSVVPFKDTIMLGGIAFSHYFPSGVMARPIGGEHVGATLCRKLHTSAVVGHSHLYDHSERTRPDGQKLFGLAVGCYTHPDFREGWNANTVQMWWRGVVLLNDLDGAGYYDDLRIVTQRKILRDYGEAA